MLSDVRYEIKNFITCYLTWNFDTKKSGLVRTQRTNNWSWLIRLMMKMLKIRPRTDPQNVLQCDLKKRKNINTHPIYIVIDHHFLHWLWQIFLMWSQINVLLSIRLTGGRQIDFKVWFLNAKKIFLES